MGTLECSAKKLTCCWNWRSWIQINLLALYLKIKKDGWLSTWYLRLLRRLWHVPCDNLRTMPPIRQECRSHGRELSSLRTVNMVWIRFHNRCSHPTKDSRKIWNWWFVGEWHFVPLLLSMLCNHSGRQGNQSSCRCTRGCLHGTRIECREEENKL